MNNIWVSKTKKLMRMFGNLLMVASVFYVIRAILILDIDYIFFNSQLLLITCFLLAVYIGSQFLLAYAWMLCLEFISMKKLRYKEVASVYTRANLGKYLPGNVMHMVWRNALAEKINCDQIHIALATTMEIAYLCFISALLGSFLSSKDLLTAFQRYSDYLWWLLIIITVFAIVSIIVIIKWKEKLYTVGARFLSWSFFWLTCKNFFIYSLILLIFSIPMLVVIALNVSLTSGQVFTILAGYFTSWLLGYVIIGAPGGLGVREASLLFLLQGVCSNDLLLFAIVFQRVISILGDILSSIAGFLLNRHSTI